VPHYFPWHADSFGVAFFDGVGGGGMVGEVVLEPAIEAIGSSPAAERM